MKTIEEVKTRTIEEKIVKYIASDGTEFCSQEECVKYENSSFCAINERVQPLLIRKTSECCLYGVGSDEDDVFVFRVNSSEDVYNINCFIDAYAFKVSGSRSNDLDHIKEDTIGKRVVVNYGYECDWCYVSSIEDIIESFDKIGRE